MSPLIHSEKPADARRILIIGGGVMGLSTAWHLLKDGHNDVSVLDQANPLAASRDISKIFRIDHADPDRMKLVRKSKTLWEKDDLFNPFFYHTGYIVAYPPNQVDALNGIDRARSGLRLPARKHESAMMLQDIFESRPTSEALEVVYNEDDGVLDLNGVMEEMKEECIDMGGNFQEGHALHLNLNGEGTIDAVVTPDHLIDTAQTDVILTGPWIMQLLEASHIRQPPLSRAPIASGTFAFSLEMIPEVWAKYHALPRFCEIGVCEFVCHPKDVGMGKVTVIKSFKYPSGDGAISVPVDLTETNLAIKSMLDARGWLQERIPGLRGARVTSIWSTWDGVTSNQKPLIARHPDYSNLVIAGGGSYTHDQDLPYIGRVITEVLHESESHTQFGWDESSNENQTNIQPSLQTTLLFGNLELEAAKDKRVREWKRGDPDWVI